MRLELKDISDSGLVQEYTCSLEEFPLLLELQNQEEFHFVGPIAFRLRLQRVGQIVEIDGFFTASLAITCGHCLQGFQLPLAGDFALTYTPLSPDTSAELPEELELDADELGLVYYKNDTLELLQPLQEQVLMAVPMSPVCSENCKGLCPECGCDLNKKSCHCEKKAFNNRFSALAGLKLDTSD